MFSTTIQEIRQPKKADDIDHESDSTGRFAIALFLYAVWCGLAWLSSALGETTIDARNAIIILAGISATNALFFGISRASPFHRPSETSVTAMQCVFGIVWATFYTYHSVGAGELVMGMYITTILFAIFQVNNTVLASLTGFAVISFGSVTFAKGLLMSEQITYWTDTLSLLAFLAVMTCVIVYGRHITLLKEQLQNRNEELRSVIQKISHVAERDHLTKSFNRHYIMDSLAREKGRTDRSNNPFSICIFDLDHFKLLNDDYGHLVGDRILRGFAQRVRGELRTMDAVNRSEHRRSFGRFGGEEFIAILPATNLEGAARAAERIRKSVHDRVFDDTYKVTVSVGVAEYKRGEAISQLLKRADQALYQAKDNGRDRVCVSELKKARAKKARVMDLPARIQK
jgi:diguanylate cyclase (GGDEF)-like protein